MTHRVAALLQKGKTMNYFAGIDIGSTTSKCVIFDERREHIGDALTFTSYNREESGYLALSTALEKAGIGQDDLVAIGTTGYGRRSIEIATTVSPEVICHARGTEEAFPGVRTIIDVGGQDSKIIEVQNGLAMKFEMNDKCAAGTGRFFEILSGRLLNVPIKELGPMAMASKNPVRLSSMCTIFAETEIVSMLSQGVHPNDISKGLLISILRRILSMAGQSSIALKEPIVLSGGFSLNTAAAPTFEEITGKKAFTLDDPQYPAAIGAALIAYDEWLVNHEG